ncbi:MAG: Asp/Glu/hydantoin racemase, partial [Chloroflexi bacterium]|nr:Asp/Glu/hydantoin racemase [Chloroflexota bacterium]
MKRKQLTILFTGMVPVAGTVALARELLPEARVVSIVDDSLLDDALAAGGLTRDITRRMCQYALAAEDGGA